MEGYAQKPFAMLSAMDCIRRSRASMLAQAARCGLELDAVRSQVEGDALPIDADARGGHYMALQAAP